MKFIKVNEIFKVIRITGPSHNLLGLSFYEKGESLKEVEVIVLQKKDNDPSKMRPIDIKNQVLDGLNEVNNQLNKDYKIKRIYFIDTDTPNEEIYKQLTKELILKIHSGYHFNSE